MARLAEGDRTAFRPAFALLWPRLRAFALRFAGEADADDAAQAALLKIFSRAARYDPGRDAFTWALAIAAWECRTVRRKRERRREGAAVPVDLAAVGASPEDAAIERDLRRAVEETAGTLPSLDCETILAAASGTRPVAPATFRKRLQRALARFRSAWRAKHGSE